MNLSCLVCLEAVEYQYFGVWKLDPIQGSEYDFYVDPKTILCAIQYPEQKMMKVQTPTHTVFCTEKEWHSFMGTHTPI